MIHPLADRAARPESGHKGSRRNTRRHDIRAAPDPGGRGVPGYAADSRRRSSTVGPRTHRQRWRTAAARVCHRCRTVATGATGSHRDRPGAPRGCRMLGACIPSVGAPGTATARTAETPPRQRGQPRHRADYRLVGRPALCGGKDCPGLRNDLRSRRDVGSEAASRRRPDRRDGTGDIDRHRPGALGPAPVPGISRTTPPWRSSQGDGRASRPGPPGVFSPDSLSRQGRCRGRRAHQG